MKPFVLVEIEDGAEFDTTAVGDSDLMGIVVDWDQADMEDDYASDKIEEIKGRYLLGEVFEPKVFDVLERLKQIVAEANEEEDIEDDCYDEDDDYDDEEEDEIEGDIDDDEDEDDDEEAA